MVSYPSPPWEIFCSVATWIFTEKNKHFISWEIWLKHRESRRGFPAHHCYPFELATIFLAFAIALAKMVKKEGGNPGEKRGSKTKDGGSTDESQTSYKNIALLCLMIFPSLFWLAAVGSDVMSNFGSVFGHISKALSVTGLLVIPVIAGYFIKPLRGFVKLLIPVLFAVLLLPTFHVYFCSPLQIKNENIGTQFSLKTTAAEFLQQACEDVCLNNSKIPSSYSMTLFTPRVSLKVKFSQIVDLNLTTSAMVGGEKLPVAKIVLLKSWRSVKGKYFALHIITRVPVKIKKFQEGLTAKQGMILSGRVENIPTDLKNLRSELEKQRHFLRPFILEVFRATLMEEWT